MISAQKANRNKLKNNQKIASQITKDKKTSYLLNNGGVFKNLNPEINNFCFKAGEYKKKRYLIVALLHSLPKKYQPKNIDNLTKNEYRNYRFKFESMLEKPEYDFFGYLWNPPNGNALLREEIKQENYIAPTRDSLIKFEKEIIRGSTEPEEENLVGSCSLVFLKQELTNKKFISAAQVAHLPDIITPLSFQVVEQ